MPVVSANIMTTQATYNQTLVDLCLQVNGNLDTLVSLAQVNAVAVNATLEAGQDFSYSGKPSVPQVAKYFELNDVQVVTGGSGIEPYVNTLGETSQGRKLAFPIAQPLPSQYQPVYGQSLIDTCLQLNGSLDTLVAMAQANNTVVSAMPEVTQYLAFDTQAQALNTVAERYRLNDTYVVTLDDSQGLSIIQTEFENSEYEGEEYA
jgi:hypothetical protein